MPIINHYDIMPIIMTGENEMLIIMTGEMYAINGHTMMCRLFLLIDGVVC